MHVHVDRFRRYVEKQHDGRVAVKVEGIAGAVRGMGEDPILHQASVDEEELIAAAAETQTAGDEAVHGDVGDGRLDRLEMRGRFVADDLQHAIAGRAGGGEIENGPSVVLDAEGTRRLWEGIRRDDGDDGAELGIGALEELAAGRNVLEKLAHGDGRAAVACGRPDVAAARQRIAIDLDGVSGLTVEGLQGKARDGRDRREGLATETERPNTREVLENADLRRGVTLQREPGILFRHARSVVADLDELAAAVLEDDVDGHGPGVDGVLDELLDHRGGALDHFTGGDLVDEVRGEDGDAGHGESMKDEG